VNTWRAPSSDGRPALGMATLPAPVQPESSSMLRNHCFGLHDHKDRSPTIPELREPSPQDSESLKFNWFNQYGFFARDSSTVARARP
jgi:hypothetical protein